MSMIMQCPDNDSPAYIKSLLYPSTPYAASSQSICYDSSSQSSEDLSCSTIFSASSDSDSFDSYCLPSTTSHRQDSSSSSYNQQTFSSPQWKQTSLPAASEATALPGRRANPRRTGSGATTPAGRPPALVRQSERKLNFVDNLVDSSTQIVETIWPLSSVACRSEMGSKGVLPLRTFIQETLRRSRTSYSTLQVALYYLILIKPHVPAHDFTMEQPHEAHSNRVLQCGRRMFLAALILASKYLQDRNFSTRAWSKISGLSALEINQNEIAFLTAVKWKLHITDEVFQRWTEVVLKLTPHQQPPSPGSPLDRMWDSLGLDWKQVIMKLNPALDNVEGLVSLSPKPKREPASPSTHVLLPLLQVDSLDAASPPIPSSCSAPLVMEPALSYAHDPSGRLAPALGLLPTPRLTPQSNGFSTPAVSASSLLLGKSCSSMGMAMAQAPSLGAAHALDRWPTSNTSSPQCYLPARRSSLANTVSAASSPESMIADLTPSSRSSSFSSASSMVSAPSTKLDVQARCRYAKLCGERYMRPTIIASVREDYENCFTSSPETFESNGGKSVLDVDDLNGATDAARTLQSLAYTHTSFPLAACSSPTRLVSKRSRAAMQDNGLQDNVRDVLRGRQDGEPVWSDNIVHSRGVLSNERAVRVPVHSPFRGGSKRLCCPTEVS